MVLVIILIVFVFVIEYRQYESTMPVEYIE